LVNFHPQILYKFPPKKHYIKICDYYGDLNQYKVMIINGNFKQIRFYT
jgi:hypothetical protein